mgnify:FL=1
MSFLLTLEEFVQWFSAQQPQVCGYCDLADMSLDIKFVKGHTPKMLTIDRKNSDLPYTTSNIILSCWRCNRAKGAVFTYEEWRKIGQMFVKPKWQAMAGIVPVKFHVA